MSHPLSLTAQLVIAVAVDVVVNAAICVALYAVMSTFLWAWLAFILSLVASFFVVQHERIVGAKRVAFDYATTGAAKALDWFAARRAAR